MYTVVLHRLGFSPENVLVYNLPEASETVLAYQKKYGMRASDMGGLHGDVTYNRIIVAQVSYNGRVWSKDDEGDFAVLEHEPVYFP
jgi:hypothetical protein